MTNFREQLLSQLESRRDQHTQLLRTLVQATERGEEAVQELVSSAIESLGCRVETIRKDPRELRLEHEFATDRVVASGERVTVAGRLPGTGGGRSLLLFAHPDGEPVHGVESWSRPPFEGVVEGGRMYGWAVADDLLGVATMIAGLDAVVSAGLRPKGDVVIVSAASKRNAQGIIAAMDRGYVADGAVYFHPAESGHGLDEIKALTAGVVEFRVTVPGKLPDTSEPSHTAFYHLAVNPIDKSWLIYRALASLAEWRAIEVHHPLIEAAIGRSTNLQISFIQSGDEGRLTRMSAACVLAGAVSFPPGEEMASVQRQIEEAISVAAGEDDWLRDHPPTVEWLSGSPAVEVPADHPLYQVVSNAVTRVTGTQPVVYPLHSASDIRNPRLHSNIPTVGLGSLAGDLSQAGGHDEWIDLDDYFRAIEVCSTVIADWCGPEGGAEG